LLLLYANYFTVAQKTQHTHCTWH